MRKFLFQLRMLFLGIPWHHSRWIDPSPLTTYDIQRGQEVAKGLGLLI